MSSVNRREVLTGTAAVAAAPMPLRPWARPSQLGPNPTEVARPCADFWLVAVACCPFWYRALE
jgi:hypothetical protein